MFASVLIYVQMNPNSILSTTAIFLRDECIEGPCGHRFCLLLNRSKFTSSLPYHFRTGA